MSFPGLLVQVRKPLYGAYAPSMAPPAGGPHGLLEQRRATCHPGRVEALKNKEAADSRVVVDGNCITSRGPGTAVEFALKLVELVFGPQKEKEVAGPLVL